jgi:hypothetical protein
MQLYGKQSGRDSRVAYEAGRDCMACWLVGQWETKNDPRAKREDRYKLAAAIAEGKGIRISVPDNVPSKSAEPVIAMDGLSVKQLQEELSRRQAQNNQ